MRESVSSGYAGKICFLAQVCWLVRRRVHKSLHYALYVSVNCNVFITGVTSVVWMRETWQTTPHLWSLASFSALNSQSWLHHHPQPWSTGKAPSRYTGTLSSLPLVTLDASSFLPTCRLSSCPVIKAERICGVTGLFWLLSSINSLLVNWWLSCS